MHLCRLKYPPVLKFTVGYPDPLDTIRMCPLMSWYKILTACCQPYYRTLPTRKSMSNSVPISVAPISLKMALAPSDEIWHEWLTTQDDEFSGFKENPTEEEQAKVAKQREVFDARVKRFQKVDAKFVEADLTKAFKKWTMSIGLKIPPCPELAQLRVNFEKMVLEMEDTSNAITRDAAAKKACEKYRDAADENLFEEWLTLQPNLYVRAIAHTGHNMKIQLKKDFEKLCACKWVTADSKDFVTHLLTVEKGPAGLDNLKMAKSIMKLVYAKMPAVWLTVGSRDLAAVVEQGKEFPDINKSADEMLERLNQVSSSDEEEEEEEEEEVAEVAEAESGALPPSDEVTPALVEDEPAESGALPPSDEVTPAPVEVAEAAPVEDEPANPTVVALQALGKAYDKAPAPAVAELEAVSVAEEDVEGASAAVPALSEIVDEEAELQARLDKLRERKKINNAKDIDAKMKPVFDKLCFKRKIRSFQRPAELRKALKELPPTKKKKIFHEAFEAVIKKTDAAEKLAIKARDDARAEIKELCVGYFGSFA